ncbi:DUF3817 domain-containing protein [Natronoglycomyces albus]|uniref:DUF3817 domain-containing protein n=1 Tax=Natronoglycomyces albus TaxID=2811108 RepID=A0A895XY31_9ACTN|nr:DUF3817 domain-containing protein [Natronoglycomyces albus]
MPLDLKIFRVVAIAEACSWAGLLIGMYFKYLGGGNDIGVAIFGPIHGALFMAYLLAVLVSARLHSWPLKELLIGGICSVPPFATLWFDHRVMKRFRAQRDADVPAPGEEPKRATADV